jgi:hypothetical protein
MGTMLQSREKWVFSEGTQISGADTIVGEPLQSTSRGIGGALQALRILSN